MQSPELRSGGRIPPGFFGQADTMFARNGASPSQHLAKKLIEGLCCIRRGSFFRRDHQVDMNIPIAGMAERGDLDTEFFLQDFGQLKQGQ